MSKNKRPPNHPQLVNPAEEIPPGTRQVTQTTVAKFTEPISSLPPSAEQAVAPEDDAELGSLEEEFVDEEEEVLLSPLDRFLASLSEADDAVIYVRRKTDPPGLQRPFKNQWTSPIVTIGEIPYDESFTDKTAIDLAVQKIFGGGYFQLQIRRSGGQILKTWSTLIADVVAPEAHREESTAKPQAVDDNSLSEIERSINVVERIWTLMNSRRPGRPGESSATPSATPPPLPPADPATEFERQVDTLEKMTSVMERLRPSGGNGEQTLGTTAINAVGSLLRDPNVGPGIGALLSAFASTLSAPTKPAGNGNGSLPPRPPHVEPGAWQQPAEGGGNPTVREGAFEPSPDTQPPAPNPAELAYGRLLRRCAADMCYSTDHRDGDGELDDVCSADVAVTETIKLVHNFPEYRMQIQLVLAASPQQLVEFVAQQCQDATLLQNPGSALFAADYQNMLREALSEPPAPAPETPTGTESEPPAAVGGSVGGNPTVREGAAL